MTGEAAGDADSGPLTGHPVSGLGYLRRRELVLLTWVWPQDATEATVRWQSDAGGPASSGTERCTRPAYENNGGFSLRAGTARVTFRVEALRPGAPAEREPPSVVVVAAAPSYVTYRPAVASKRGRKWTIEVTFAADAAQSLPPLRIVRGNGAYRPRSARDGDEVYRVPAQSLAPGEPATVKFTIDRPRGTCWLVCLPADDDPAGALLRPASLRLLRVN